MNRIHFTYAFFLLGGIAFTHTIQAKPTAFVHPPIIDSVGVEKKDGKRFILHRVDEGQTLYAIARRYKRSVAEIKAANPDMKDAVRYDQLVRVPIPDGALSRKEEKAIDKAVKKKEKEEKREAKAAEKEKELMAKPVAKAEKEPEKEQKKTDDPARAGIHVVETGQTLYSLAGRYGVQQSDLRKWNNLSGNNVLIGQALIVSEKAYLARTPSAPAPKTTETPTKETPTKPATTSPEPRSNEPRATTPTEPKPERHLERETATSPTKPSATDTKPAEAEVEPPRPGNDAPMPTRGRRISASGIAEMIEADGSGKYLALHRTAPIGTLVQVRNEFNNQSLWVKVIGRLPNTGVNDKILIKLSAQAFAKLSPDDRRFRAEVSYIAR
ncbi:DPBB and LysM peptidoglycan-binding domain-containing protein [Spirosoma foliorum]|uniref:LysM peptidoglycan-binding domain-containing protein n=1 Tax=Spirosoma foliorum TaxID=2710596 RepID=A0A7G5GND3_9BACT|nr:LysM peptidoglycan-binding domain-containing protein [Spirosoma foliorum]QMW00375.1 LysM peptidoglycan-binding domain-containing protein [Spirosoma foliorum]